MLDAPFLAAARALIAADSVTERGNLRAVEVLEPLCREAGLEPRRLPSPDSADRDANLLAGPGGGPDAEGPPLLLVTHLDTVDPGPVDRWRTDPFAFTIVGDRAHGLGVADVKLDALCKLAAAARFKGERLARPFWFLGTYGEEVGLRGARAFLQNPPFQAAYVLCGEPCSLKVYDAHKGYAVVRVRVAPKRAVKVDSQLRLRLAFLGKAAHSSTPHLGANAIDRALEALSGRALSIVSMSGGQSTNTIPALCEVIVTADTLPPDLAHVDESQSGPLPAEAPRPDLAALVPVAQEVRRRWAARVAALRPESDSRFEPAHAVANLTRLRTVDGALELVLDARLLPEHDAEALVAGYVSELAQLGGDEATVTLAHGRAASGMSLAAGSPLVTRLGAVLRRFGLDGAPHAKATSTEAGVFARSGAEAVVFGPSPTTGNAHTANEYAVLDEVERAIDLYEAFIRELCGPVT